MSTIMRIVAAMALFTSYPAQAAPDGREQAITQLASKHSQSAIAAAVIQDGEVTFTAVTGPQTAEQRAIRSTLFNIASLTKPITAELIVRLAAERAIDLDEPLAKAWVDPDIANDARNRLLTPRIMLSHQSGFPNWRPQNRRLRFVRDPATAFGYSGEGYEYLANYVQKRIGTDFETLVEQHVFAPLGLRDIAYTWRPWMEGRVAVPAQGKDFPGAAGPGAVGRWSAADNVYTTIGDYAGFVAAVVRGDGLSKPQAIERLRSQIAVPGCPKPAAACPTASGMALGWMVLTFGEQRIAIHEGGDPGVSTMAYFDPATRDGVVVFISGEGGTPLILDVLNIIDPGSPVLRAFHAMTPERE